MQLKKSILLSFVLCIIGFGALSAQSELSHEALLLPSWDMEGTSDWMTISNTNQFTFFTLTSSGKLGIGPSFPIQEPERKMHIRDTGNISLFLQSSNNEAGIELMSNNNSFSKIYAPLLSDDLRFWQEGEGDVMTIKPNGDIGMGTDAPSEALEVMGNVKADTFIGSAAGLIDLPSDADWLLPNGDPATNISSSIYTNGNVGIGHTSPAYPIDIRGTLGERLLTFSQDGHFAGLLAKNNTREFFIGVQGTFETDDATSGFHIYDNTAGARRFVIDEDGDVGINESNPSERLHVGGNIRVEGNFTSGSPSNDASGLNSFSGGGENNVANAKSAFNGGGEGNIASGLYSFTGGGLANTASGERSFVSGGSNNVASAYISYVGGGFHNTASSEHATVSGGTHNTASGNSSFIAGGRFSQATGDHAFIGAGERIKAKSFSEAVVGMNNEDYTPNSTSAYDSTDRLFVIGNGVDFMNRSNAMTVLKDGRVGVGTSSPEAILQTSIDASFSDTLLNRTGLFLDNTSQDGVFPDDPNNIALLFGENGTPKQAIIGATYANDYLKFYTGEDFTNARISIDGSGDVGIGEENPNHPLHMGSGAHCTAGGTWTNASDRRLKKDITPISYGLSEVLSLRPVSYQIRSNNDPQIGFIAQEVQELLPELISGKEGDMDKGETLGMSYGNLTAVLVKAIQEQQTEIVTLKSQNEYLLSQVSEMDALNSRLAKLEAAFLNTAQVEKSLTEK